MNLELICKGCGDVFVVRKGKEYRQFCSRKCYVKNPVARLMSFVDKDSNGCWNFKGSERGNGYGQFKLDGKVWCAHQASWILHRGDIPEGLLVLHNCIGNRRCVNPDHLRLGTHKENTADMFAQGRQHDQRGSKNHSAVLDENKVRHMRSIPYFRGMYVHYSNLYGVEISVVRRAIIGKTWQHVK